MKYVALLSILLLTSCYSAKQAETREALNSLVGQHYSTAYRMIGPPTYVTDDGQGGKIHVFSKQSYTPGAPPRTLYGNDGRAYTTPGYAGRTTWKHYMIYSNESGEVYYWRTEANQVPPTEIHLYIGR